MDCSRCRNKALKIAAEIDGEYCESVIIYTDKCIDIYLYIHTYRCEFGGDRRKRERSGGGERRRRGHDKLGEADEEEVPMRDSSNSGRSGSAGEGQKRKREKREGEERERRERQERESRKGEDREREEREREETERRNGMVKEGVRNGAKMPNGFFC